MRSGNKFSNARICMEVAINIKVSKRKKVVFFMRLSSFNLFYYIVLEYMEYNSKILTEM